MAGKKSIACVVQCIATFIFLYQAGAWHTAGYNWLHRNGLESIFFIQKMCDEGCLMYEAFRSDCVRVDNFRRIAWDNFVQILERVLVKRSRKCDACGISARNMCDQIFFD